MTPNEAVMDQLRGISEGSNLVGQIQDHAEAIGRAMGVLHGRDFKVRIDHECAFVVITPRC